MIGLIDVNQESTTYAGSAIEKDDKPCEGYLALATPLNSDIQSFGITPSKKIIYNSTNSFSK